MTNQIFNKTISEISKEIKRIDNPCGKTAKEEGQILSLLSTHKWELKQAQLSIAKSLSQKSQDKIDNFEFKFFNECGHMQSASLLLIHLKKDIKKLRKELQEL